MEPAAPTTFVPLIGLVVFDQYRVVSTLSSEPRGASYLAVPVGGGGAVVARFLSHPVFARAAQATWGAIADRFERLLALDHPHVERVITGGLVSARGEDLLCIVTEQVEGRPLQSHLRARGRLPVTEALAVARRVALGLDAAHQAGVVHGDLRAANVLLAQPPRGDQGPWPVLSDVGVNNLLVAALGPELSMRELAWSPDSAAPEQIRGEPATVATDVYALGLLLYRMLSGATPFPTDNPSELLIAQLSRPPMALRERGADNVPAEVEALVARCLAKHPEERFDSAAAALDAVMACEAALRGAPAPERRSRPSAEPAVTPSEPGGSPSRQSLRASGTRLVLDSRPSRTSAPPGEARHARLATQKGPVFKGALPVEPEAPSADPDATAPFQAQPSPQDVVRAMRPLALAVVGLTLVCGLLGGYVLAALRNPPTVTTPAALAAPPRTPPRAVRVRVRSNAPGAQAVLRGRPFGLPLATEIAPGAVPEMVEVSAPGYETRRMWVSLGEHLDAQIDLSALPPPAAAAPEPPVAAERPRAGSRHRIRANDAPARRTRRSRVRAR